MFGDFLGSIHSVVPDQEPGNGHGVVIPDHSCTGIGF